MEILKCIIADDEPIARQILENYIEQIPNLEVLASCKDAFEVMKILQNQSADILFLDINMPKTIRFKFVKNNAETTRCDYYNCVSRVRY